MIYLILLLGLGLRLINLNQSLWLDEAISVQAVKNNSLINLLTQFAPGDVHPPFYYLILKLWTNFFGYSEIATRAPSIIFSLGTVFLVYLIGKKLFSEKVGIIAALFLAVNPLIIYYAQEARMYSLDMFLVAGTIYFLLEEKLVWFAGFVGLSLYTDYPTYLMLPVYFFLAKDKKKLLVSSLFLLVAILPWLPIFFKQFFAGVALSRDNPLWGEVVGGFSLKDIPLTFVKFIIGRISFTNKLLYGVLMLPTCIVYALAIFKSKSKFLWLWFSLPIILGIIVSLKVPIFSYHRFLFVMPAFVLLIANGAQKNRWIQIFIILISLLSVVYFNLNPFFWREDWRAAASYINSDPGRVVMPNFAQDPPLLYYQAIMNYKNSPVYLIRYVQEIFDPQDTQRKTLEAQGYKKISEKSFTNLLVWKYSL